MNFTTYNVQFEILADENFTQIKGDIINETARNFTVALFKIFVYSKEDIIGRGILKVYEFRAGATKHFEATLDLHRLRIPTITGYEMLFEQGY